MLKKDLENNSLNMEDMRQQMLHIIEQHEKIEQIVAEVLRKCSGEIRERLVHIENKEDKILKRDKEEILTEIRKSQFSRGMYEKLFIGAIPDSIIKGGHPNYFELLPQFVKRNSDNNVLDYSRYISFILNIEKILKNGVQGAFAEVGIYLGNNAAVMLSYCTDYQRKLFLFDTYEGFDKRDIVGVDEKQKILFQDTSLERVKAYVGENEYTRYVKGYFPESVTEEAREESFAFVSLDCDLYNPTKFGLEFFWPRMSNGGMIFIHDYSSGYFEGCTKAVDEFCKASNINVVLMPDKSGTAVLSK